MTTNSVKALVVQMGARRGYEMARMLAAQDALSRLETDVAWASSNPNRHVLAKIFPAYASAIKRRTIEGVEPAFIRSTLAPNLAGVVLGALGAHAERKFRVEDWFLGAHCRFGGLGNANVVLSVAGNGGIKFLHWAQKRGMRIATDVVITPKLYESLREERELWPGWEAAQTDDLDPVIFKQHMEDLISVSDLLLCPSDVVVDGLRIFSGFDQSKVSRVPYSLGATSIQRGAPEEKRVLFSGEAGLRKGLPYLAEAARLLKRNDPQVHVRVAGHVSDRIRKNDLTRDLCFLGHISPEAMNEELFKADVFCLPSLAEGMASVTLEALAHAVPCVLTRSAGGPVVHGREGLIVKERDASAIADALATIIYDRDLRNRMAGAALQTAENHVFERISVDLHSALLRLVS